MIEIWKDVPGYEGLYKVSNLGNVLSLNYRRTRKAKLLKLLKRANGYCYVELSKNGVTRKINVHCLVAKVFVPNPNNYPIINHKDENPSNNCFDNLEWCSYSYNTNYGTANEKRSQKQSKRVACYTKNGELIKIYNSIIETTKDGFKDSAVSASCKQRYGRKYHHGYIFKYVD